MDLAPKFDIPLNAVKGIYGLQKQFMKWVTWIN